MPSQLVTSAIAIACFMIAIVSVAEAGTKKVYPGGAVTTNKLPKTMALTSSDCRKVDGRVVEVGDDRCGGSSRLQAL